VKPRHGPLRAIASLLVPLVSAACGGGSGSGQNGSRPPPPLAAPPVFSTPTAVRVSQATPFASGCLPVPGGATLYVNSEVEPHLAIDASDPNHLVAAWQQDRLSDGGARGLVTAVSVDSGTSWTGLRASPFSQCAGGALARVSDPWLSVNGSTVIQVGIAFTGGVRSAVLASRSVDGGFSWSAPVELASDDGSQYFNDKESVTIDPTDPSHVYVVWNRLEGDERGPAMLARSVDGGISWSPPTAIYDPGSGGRQTIGNVVVVAPDGIVLDFFTELEPSPTDPDQTTGRLAVIRSLDKGLTWSEPVHIADLLPVGTRLRTEPRLDVRAGEILGAFVADPQDGTLYAVWQDSRFSGGAHDSIAMTWSQDSGVSWSEPVAVNADTTVPAFTPTLAVLSDGTIGVAYYDLRQAGTAAFQPTDFWLTSSRDRSAWYETRLAGNFDMRNAPNAGGLFVGDYQGLAGHGTAFVALYARTNNGDSGNRTDVYADRLDSSAATAGKATTSRKVGKFVLPDWTPAAQERVSRHLTGIRAMRRHQWQQWLNAVEQRGAG
jgi:hypothetical protein